jgi:hypothetical protein
MKLIQLFSIFACAAALLAAPAMAREHETCCTRAKAAGKKCDHKCCVKADKEGRLCEKCNGKKEK